MGDHEDPLRIVDRVVAEPQTRRLGLRDRHIGQLDDLLEHRTLVRGGVGQDGVEHRDATGRRCPQQVEDLVAVGSPVDPVLVLEDDDAGILDGVAHPMQRRGVAGDPVDRGSRRTAGRFASLDEADDHGLHRAARVADRTHHRLGERRQAALGRGESPHERDAKRLFPVGTAASQRREQSGRYHATLP